MLYAFGDSYTFGFNFFKEHLKDRLNLVYPFFLSQKLGVSVKNISYPAVSNWWIARQVMSTNFNESDVVVIGWTSNFRFEFGVSHSSLAPNSKVLPLEKLLSLEDEVSYGEDLIEKDADMYTRRYQLWIANNLMRSSKSKISTHMENMFLNHTNYNWLDTMSYMLISAVIHKLNATKCKFVMFNTFRGFTNINFDISLLNIPQYELGPKDNMLRYIRNYPSYNFDENRHLMANELDSYYSIEEHNIIANLLYKNLQEQNELH